MGAPKFDVGDRVRLVNILPGDEYPEEADKTGRLFQTNVWRNDRTATVITVKRGRVGYSGNHNARVDNNDPHEGKLEDYSYNIQFDRFQYSSATDSHTANGYFLEADGPTDEEMRTAIESIQNSWRT